MLSPGKGEAAPVQVVGSDKTDREAQEEAKRLLGISDVDALLLAAGALKEGVGDLAGKERGS